MTISLLIMLRMRNVSDKSCRENQNTHFIFNNFFPKIALLWENVKKYGGARETTDDSIIQRMRFACWITKATHIHSEFVILIVFPWWQWFGERAPALRYGTLLLLYCCTSCVRNSENKPTGFRRRSCMFGKMLGIDSVWGVYTEELWITKLFAVRRRLLSYSVAGS